MSQAYLWELFAAHNLSEAVEGFRVELCCMVGVRQVDSHCIGEVSVDLLQQSKALTQLAHSPLSLAGLLGSL